jgi:2-C-methyl-D-erythritol 4-phosphate cytidylyltransferase
MRICVIIPAAGSSGRFQSEGLLRSKLDEDLGGKPVLQRTVEIFTRLDRVASIVVAGPADAEQEREFRTKYADKMAMLGATICRGGTHHRWQTVQNALEHAGDCTHIAVHDAARPCVSPALVERLFDAAEKHAAVIPGVPVPDTVKRVREEDAGQEEDDPIGAILGVASGPKVIKLVENTVERSGLVLVQTPQVFKAGLLRRAYAQADLTSTDDASLVERLGERVVVIEGEARNIKITRPPDLDLARAILGYRAPEGRAAHKRF